MVLGAWSVPGWLPISAKRWLWTALDRWKLEPMGRPAVQVRIEQLGLPPVAGSLFGDWLHGPDGGLALYPAWFAPVPAEWQARGVRQVGFPMFEAAPVKASTAGEVGSFRADPRPYALVFPGSAATGGEFIARAGTACHALGLRVLAVGDTAASPANPGDDDLCVPQGSLPLLLSGAAAFIHHGGIGSLAQGVAAGVPQLVLASAYDQFENGARLQRLGMGRCVAYASASTLSIQGLIRDLLAARHAVPKGLLLHSRPGCPNDAVQMACELLDQVRAGPKANEASSASEAPRATIA
jgi:rhamnosyltransferase subunit B